MKDAAKFLHANSKMAPLLPTATRLVALQKDCLAALPALFTHCTVLHLDSLQLVVAVPHAALATKLKQQLPTLQARLLKCGWQIKTIRIKVQANVSFTSFEPAQPTKQAHLPPSAIPALTALNQTLPASPRNDALKKALEMMVQRHT